MDKVESILDMDLPIAVIDLAKLAAVSHQFSVGRTVDHVVERIADRGEVVGKRRAAGREVDKNETAIAVDLRDRFQAITRVVDIELRWIARRQRNP